MRLSTTGLKLSVSIILGIVVISYAVGWKGVSTIYGQLRKVDTISDLFVADNELFVSVHHLHMSAMTVSSVPIDKRMVEDYGSKKQKARDALSFLKYLAEERRSHLEEPLIRYISNTDALYQSFETQMDNIFSTKVLKPESWTGEVQKAFKDLLENDERLKEEMARYQRVLCDSSKKIWITLSSVFLMLGVIGLTLITMLVLFIDRMVIKNIDKTEKQAHHDHLTGALNRHGMDRLVAKYNLNTSLSINFGIVLLDIDHFKKLNDTYGHDTGDMVLRQMVRLVMSVIRGGDSVIRFGGEEFLVFFPETDIIGVVEAGEKIRSAVEKFSFIPGEGDPLNITISGGTASSDDGTNLEEVIKAADERLYKAKAAGRNRLIRA